MAVNRSDDVRNHFVYRAFDASGRLLYVGCTQNLTTRWQQHRFSNRHWTVQTARVRVQGPYPYKRARQIESAAVQSENPAYGWTPERGDRLRRRKQWQDNRLQELLAGKQPRELHIDVYIALSEVAARESYSRFPNIFNSDNHPTNGVPESLQPFLPYATEAVS